MMSKCFHVRMRWTMKVTECQLGSATKIKDKKAYLPYQKGGSHRSCILQLECGQHANVTQKILTVHIKKLPVIKIKITKTFKTQVYSTRKVKLSPPKISELP